MKKNNFILLVTILSIVIAACSKVDETTTPEPDPDFAAPLFHTLATNGVPTDSFVYNGGKLVELWNREPGATSYNLYYEFIYENNKAAAYNIYIQDGGSFRLKTKAVSKRTGEIVKIYTQHYGPGGTKLLNDSSEALVNTSNQILRIGSPDTLRLSNPLMGSYKVVHYQQYTYEQHTLKSSYTHSYRSETIDFPASLFTWHITATHSNTRNTMYFLIANDPVLKLFLNKYNIFFTGPTAITSYYITNNKDIAVTSTYTYTYNNNNSQWTEMIAYTPVMGDQPATTTKYTATYKPVTIK
ncbi:hypothetical protein [Chitinophaga solisilvae]|uniref:hypothetical protein n=1 Tax=Chitinophaga solisilvae TaxID=1233460 RepID=UPI00136EC5B9|nr:hypothetical protein [Chitinophaga solisilvae]